MRIKYKYLLAGLVFGLMFPLGSIVFQGLVEGHFKILDLHMKNPLMFMIDSAPIFLGAFAYVGGLYQEKARAVNADLQESARAKEGIMADLEGQKKTLITVQEATEKSNAALSETLAFIKSYVQRVLEDIMDLDTDIAELHQKSHHLLIKSTGIKDQSQRSYDNHQVGNRIINDMCGSVVVLSDELKAILKVLDNEQGNIETLSRNLYEINALKERIEGISDQIDLLALNASIEASRVGEAGKGFAVVALEIKKLSLESQEATLDMAAYLKEITHNFDKVSDTMTDISTDIRGLDTSIHETKEGVLAYQEEQNDEILAIKNIQETSISQSHDVDELNHALDCAKASVAHLKALVHENNQFIHKKSQS